MKTEQYNHNSAKTIADTLLTQELENALHSIEFKLREGSATRLRDEILDKLSTLGWSGKIVLDNNSGISITSVNCDHGLCLQTGNMSRFYADILKLEYLYKKKKIRAGYLIIPTKESAKKLGSNIANFERCTNELQLFSEIVSIPLQVFGLKE